MSDQSKIEWTDSTFNPWEGCTKVGPGCDHCYAEARNNRFQGGNWGPGAPRRRTSEANWRKPLKWNNTEFFACTSCRWRGESPWPGLHCPECDGVVQETRRRVFCASLADWLDNEVPIEWLVDLLDLIRQTPNLDWLLLTKRIGNWNSRILQAFEYAQSKGSDNSGFLNLACWLDNWPLEPPANVWIGATIVNQEEAGRDIPKLLKIPARVRFLSMEPLLGPVDLTDLVMRPNPHTEDHFSCLECDVPQEDDPWSGACVNWVIAGGESSPHARPSHPDWFRALRDQCQAAGVPFLFKQWGEWGPYDRGRTDSELLLVPGSTDKPLQKFGKKLAGRLLDGRTWDQFPGVS